MIWFILFIFFFFLNLKSNFFFSNLIQMSIENLFMASIIPLTMLMFYYFNYFYSDLQNKRYVLFLFTSVFLFVALTFVLSSPFTFMVFLEMTVLPMSALIVSLSKDVDKISSVLFMLFINLFGSIPFMFFSLSNLNLSLLSEDSFMLSMLNYLDVFIWVSFGLMLVCKLPVFLSHFWLTKAHVSASGCCSMILASIMLKLGSFGLFKFSMMFNKISMNFFSVMISFSCVSSLIFSTLMIRFFDIKNLIACSSILHMALLTPFILQCNSIGMISSLFMMVGHGLVSYVLFMLVTLIYETSLNRTSDLNKSLESTYKIMGLAFFTFMFLNLGVPPFINFLSELYFLHNLINVSLFSSIIFMVCMILSILFLMFFITKILFGKKVIFYNNDFDYSLSSVCLTFIVSVLILILLN